MMKSHAIIVSHQRSGTHLAIDLLRNNIPSLSAPYISMKAVGQHPRRDYFKRLMFRLRESWRLWKSHATHDFVAYHAIDTLKAYHSDIAILFKSAPCIYVYRDGRDVMVSLFYQYKHFNLINHDTAFGDFIRGQFDARYVPHLSLTSPIAYWAHHVSNWHHNPQTSRIIYIRYEDLITDPESSLSRLSCWLGAATSSRFVDVRLSTDHKILRSNRPVTHLGAPTHTTVSFRSGRIGDHRSLFSSADVDLFECVSSGANLCRELAVWR